MRSLYDIYSRLNGSEHRQHLYNLVLEYFKYDAQQINEWFEHMKIQLLKWLETDYKYQEYTNECNLKDVVDNKAELIIGQLSKQSHILQALVVVVASVTDLSDICIERGIAEKHVERIIPYIKKHLNEKRPFLLHFYNLYTQDYDLQLNTLSVLILSYNNLQYYLQKNNLTIIRGSHRLIDLDRDFPVKHRVYEYSIYLGNEYRLKPNSLQKIMYDYSHCEFLEDYQNRSYFVRKRY